MGGLENYLVIIAVLLALFLLIKRNGRKNGGARKGTKFKIRK